MQQAVTVANSRTEDSSRMAAWAVVSPRPPDNGFNQRAGNCTGTVHDGGESIIIMMNTLCVSAKN